MLMRAEGAVPAGLRLIIRYKFLKAIVELMGGATLFILGSMGLAEELAYVAQQIRHHATEAWSIAFAEWLTNASTAHNLFVVAIAVVADGVVTLIEGWALQRRYVWSRWLVLATTCSLIPFEVIALHHHPNAGRAVVLLVNALIVAYLLRGQSMGSNQATSP